MIWRSHLTSRLTGFRPLRERAFTLLEMLVVLVIIGLLVAVVGPRLFSRVDYAKVDTAKAQIKMLSTALQTYRLDVGSFPTPGQGLRVLYYPPSNSRLRTLWKGPYLQRSTPDDPWGHSYVYCIPGRNSHPFALYSYGADGKPGGTGINADVGWLRGSKSSCASASSAAGGP